MQEPLRIDPFEQAPLPEHPQAHVAERRRQRRLGYLAWRRQENAAALTHGLGLFLSVASHWLLVVASARYGNLRHLISFSIFGAALVFLYLASTILHALPRGRMRRFMGGLDLSGIFIMIAGTYTPFMLVTLQGPIGWTLLAVIWILALGGIAWIHLRREQFERRAAWIYLALGWLVVVVLRPLAEQLPAIGFWMVVGGGLSYSVGVVFFFWRRFFYHHAIWHLFVMLGSALHVLAVLFYVLPDGRGAWPLP